MAYATFQSGMAGALAALVLRQNDFSVRDAATAITVLGPCHTM